MHRLQQELLQLVKHDSEIFTFIEKSSLDGMWYWDLENPEHEWMSENFWTTLGYDPSTRQHLASEWQELINQDDLAQAIDNFTKHCADPSHPYDQVVRYLHSDGSTVWIRCRGKAIRDESGKPIRMLGAHVNITAEKERELALSETLKSRERFFARISHEIRTPLHGMIGLAENLKDMVNDSHVKHTVDTMLECGNQLQGLLNDLLTIAKIDDDKFSVLIEDIPFSSVLSNLHALFVPLAEHKSLYFKSPATSEVDFVVRSDKTRLTQILSNIISNSIKYTFNGGVDISVEKDTSHILIRIKDTGVGIKDVSRIFDAYRQESNDENSEIKGSGLGLEIVKKLCDLLEHPLELTSTIHEGTEVSIKVPLSTSQNIASTNPNYVPKSYGKLDRLLIVDDNGVNREIVSIMLQDHVNKIDHAGDGQQAIDCVSEHGPYDAILMDLNMPIKDGYTAAAEIRALCSHANENKIIAVSADTDTVARNRCLDAGIGYFLAKPFNKEKLLSMLFDSQ